MRSRLIAALAGVAVLGVCITASAAPLDAYSRLPAMDDVELSADGQNIAYVASRDERSRVVVQRLDGTVLQVVDLGDAKVANILWGSPDHVIIATRSTARIRNMTYRGELSTAASLNIRTGRAVQFFERLVGGNTYGTALFSPPIPGVWEGEPVAYVVVYAGGEQGVQGRRLDVARIDLDSGIAHTHVMGNETTYDFLVLPDGSVPAKADYNDTTGEWSISVRNGGGWRIAHRVNAPVDQPYMEYLTEDGSGVYVRMLNQGTGNWRHHPVSLASGALGNPALVDHANDLVADANMRTIGYETLREFTNFNFLDANRQRAWRMITDSLPGRQVTFQSATADFSKVVFYVEGNGYPRNYILYDATAGSLSQIGRAYPDITNQEMAEVHAIEYPAADGLTIPAYLTLPPGRGAQNLPLIVLPHGGPEGRDYAGFDWMAQALASRGYAVLQPNFRGSDGYDGALFEAGYGRVGPQDANRPLRRHHLPCQSRHRRSVARLHHGRELWRLRCACGRDAAVEHLSLRCRDRPGLGCRRILGVARHTRGGRQLRAALLDALSRCHRSPRSAPRRDLDRRAARNGNAPVLLIHGRDDSVVPLRSKHADAESALREAGRSVELVPLRAEDHYLSREPTRMQAMAAAVAFLERHNPPN